MTCSFCQTDNPEGNKFCGQCGASIDPTVGRLQTHLEDSIKQAVQRALEARLKDQKLVELETSLAVADRLSSWTKLFASFVGIPLAALAIVLGFLGFHTYNDFAELIQGARAKITPQLEEAKRDADAAATKAKDASKQVQDLGELAKETSRSFSEVSKRLAEVSTLGSEVDQLKSRAGDVQKQLTEASKVTEDVKGLTSKVGRLEQQFSKIGRVTVLTNRADGLRGLVAYMSEYGAESSTLNTNELGKIATTAPDIIIIAADTRDSWTRQPQSALKEVFANYKVVAMGYGGAQLFSALGLEIDSGHVMHSRLATPLIVENTTMLKPLSIASSDRVLQVSQAGGESIGVYDEGSPDIAGFEGIAKWQNDEHHWPIARQGNYVLWGFDSTTEQMTEAGKRLLVNLLINQKLRPPVPLSQARRKFEYVQPGLLADRLNAQFPTSRLHFQVRKPGRITARLSWNPAERLLALILNGPGQTGYFARKDGVSPIEIAFDVTDGQVSTGVDWQISLSAFGDFSGTPIDYKLELSFPTSMAGPQ